MSDNDSSTDSDNQLPDLSSLSFAPSWAKEKPKGASRSRQNDGGERRDRNEREDREGQGRGRGGDRRRSPGGRDSRGFRGNKGGRDNRGGRDSRGGRDNRGTQRGGRERQTFAEAPEGVTARIMPIEDGLDALAKDIAATGRTHSVFDIAWLVLGGLDRFYVIFESEDQLLYRSRGDHSLWLSQRECLTHFWNSGLSKKYYEEEIVEVDPPKGNFQSVARCGLSGTLIGPPNHHAYQKTLLDLHREKFSNMDLARYKSKVVMDHSEEAMQEWVDSMSKQTRWRPITEKVEAVEEVADEKSPKDSETTEKPEEVAVEAPESTEEAKPEETEAEPSAESSVEETTVILNNHLEVEQHFMTHGFETEFESGKVMSVLANVPRGMIDAGLFSLLKTTVKDERRYPGKLASILCRQLSGRHLAVFKWKKHLHCGPARPRNIPEDTVMAERPLALFKWVSEKPGGKIDAMWKELLPDDVDDETRQQWYHDLHWLINEGFVLLFSDGKLHAAKELAKKTQPPAAKKGAKKSKAKKAKPEGEQPEEEKAPELETVEFALVDETADPEENKASEESSKKPEAEKPEEKKAEGEPTEPVEANESKETNS